MVRVVFLTLLLGLVAGPRTIELAVDDTPAAVEVLVDDVVVARLSRQPWVTSLDFGEDPMPHEVVARALDEGGRELSRAVQKVNQSPDQEALDIALERDPEGLVVAARLVWRSLAAAPAEDLSLRLDGRPLEIVGSRAALPRLGVDAAHVLEARATSDSGTRSAAVVIGGAYGGNVTAELVGVALRVDGARGAEEVARCLGGPDGKSVEVRSLEAGSPEVYLVASQQARAQLRRKLFEHFPGRRGSPALAPELAKLGMPKRSRVTFYWPELEPASSRIGDGHRTELLRHSEALELSSNGLWERFSTLEPRGQVARSGSRTADATGVAVLSAAGTARPRAVVVVVSPSEPDASQFRPDQIRRLARSLHVPLHVWSLTEPATPAWGTARTFRSSSSDILKAHWALREDLESQRIAWAQGSTALHRITLRPDCAGVALVD